MSSINHVIPDDESPQVIANEIRHLEEQLALAKSRLEACDALGANSNARHDSHNGGAHVATMVSRGKHFQHKSQTMLTVLPGPLLNTTTHFLLLLADSALPLGSFAFSSGLESYLAHARLNPFSPSHSPSSTSAFDLFLPLSITSYASTTLPFLLAVHKEPGRLAELDDALDAAVVCTVGKRASVAQGRALLGIWDRSFASSSSLPSHAYGACSSPSSPALESLAEYSRLLRSPSKTWDQTGLPPVSAHLAPLFGCIAHILGLGLRQTAYIFLLGHVKALVSAAVRANLMGPYAAQRVLASSRTQEMITAAIEREWDTAPEETGQSVPTMDLWIGRHEVLYSRIFNS